MRNLTQPTPINADHRTQSFSSGNAALDAFLKREALARQSARLSRTYVVTDSTREEVVAYYTLAHVSIEQEKAPKKLARGMPLSIPAMLLARLAIDVHHQGKGLGSSLLMDAMRRTWVDVVYSSAPVRFFVVDATDENAKVFYQKWEMLESPVDPMRLFLSYKDLQQLFEPT